MSDRRAVSDWWNIAFAAIVNAAVGVLYLWGLFLLPLEGAIGRSRADLSLVPAIALAGFTVGMVLHSGLLRRFGQRGVALIAFLPAGGGHVLFAVVPDYSALVLGYGVAFGLGSGIGYGLALSLSSSVEDSRRGVAIGVAMAAFALSGIVLPLILGPAISTTAPTHIFGWIGVTMLMVGALLYFVLGQQPAGYLGGSRKATTSETWFSRRLLTLAVIFFLICFVGLMIVSHGPGIVAANGLPQRVSELIPTTFMLGYLAGSLLGGRLVEAVKGPAALIGTGLLSAVGLWFIGSKADIPALLGAAAIGLTFGGSASLMPTLIGEQYGRDQIGPIYSKLMIAYGVAGLLVPWTTGLLFEATGGYQTALILGMVMCALSALLGVALRKQT